MSADMPHAFCHALLHCQDSPGKAFEIMDDKQQIAPLSGEFRSAPLERSYRRQQAVAELRQLRLLWFTALACFALYLPVEAQVRGDWPGWPELWPRLGIISVGVLVLLTLRYPAVIAARDWVSSAGLVTAMACYGCLLAARADGSSGALLLLLLGSYLFSPCRYRLHCATGMLGSLLAAVLAGGSVSGLELSYLLPANILSALALSGLNRSRRQLYLQSRRLAREVSRRRDAQRRLGQAHRRNLALLYNALPPAVAQQLRDRPGSRPVRLLSSVTVVFADIVGFSDLVRQLTPGQLLALLDALFSAFDAAAERRGLEKIKTIGDAYLAVAGLTPGESGSGLRAVAMARDLQRAAAAIGRRRQLDLKLRIALHTGPVVAGVLGSKRYAFDIWGETVNIASRLQAAAPVDGILISEATRLACAGRLPLGAGQRFELRGCGVVTAALLGGAECRREPARQSG